MEGRIESKKEGKVKGGEGGRKEKKGIRKREKRKGKRKIKGLKRINICKCFRHVVYTLVNGSLYIIFMGYLVCFVILF